MKKERNLSELDIELAEIEIGKINNAGRDRQHYKNMDELKLSLTQKGLIHPLAVMRYENTYEGFDYFLLAGGRRFKAIKALEWEKVPVRIYPPGLNAFEIKGIELEENLKRDDLTDAERLKLIKKVHDHYVSIYGEKVSTSPDAEGHSPTDTARKLGVSRMKINKDLELAQWLEDVPALADLGDVKLIKQAIDRAKKKVARERELEEAGIDEVNESTKNYEDAYHVGDFFSLVKEVPDNSIDLVEIDIDYPMEVDHTHTAVMADKKEGIYTSISKEDYPEAMKAALKEAYRVIGKNGWCIVWFGMEYHKLLQEWGEEVGFKTSYFYGDWFKGDGYAHCRNPLSNLQHSKEHFFYFRKGAPQLNKPHSDTFTCAPTPAAQRNHPYEKPIDLMYEILSTFIKEGSRILVEFVGGGNSLIAGIKHKCYVWGSDMSGEYKKGYVLKIRTMENKRSS